MNEPVFEINSDGDEYEVVLDGKRFTRFKLESLLVDLSDRGEKSVDGLTKARLKLWLKEIEARQKKLNSKLWSTPKSSTREHDILEMRKVLSNGGKLVQRNIAIAEIEKQQLKKRYEELGIEPCEDDRGVAIYEQAEIDYILERRNADKID